MRQFDLASVDYILTTTRSVRKRLDFSRPISREVLEECLEIAIQAPTGGNRQEWEFIFVTDEDKKTAIADLYRPIFAAYYKSPRKEYSADDPRAKSTPRVLDSAAYLAEHMQKAPVYFLACFHGRVESEMPVTQASNYGSILPAVWSFMLAARARGIGSAWTTLHIVKEKETAEILGLPENITQAALLPMAYYSGEDFKPASRVPATKLTHWNQWGAK